eukprot:CAMPEP_0172209272 /NCGR_PEP_ID=MMETSP1050-20130122/35013_1 /TAXON_ID=233186 /ORGANISM="Cryptomonas curvata, Strain CCAP979/52" /LENGTH=55 /DNA_ID=CAMNT_0012889111 /DNA_START=225 /DNA_END=389 /DNA_ORIENTATION=-
MKLVLLEEDHELLSSSGEKRSAACYNAPVPSPQASPLPSRPTQQQHRPSLLSSSY